MNSIQFTYGLYPNDVGHIHALGRIHTNDKMTAHTYNQFAYQNLDLTKNEIGIMIYGQIIHCMHSYNEIMDFLVQRTEIPEIVLITFDTTDIHSDTFLLRDECLSGVIRVGTAKEIMNDIVHRNLVY